MHIFLHFVPLLPLLCQKNCAPELRGDLDSVTITMRKLALFALLAIAALGSAQEMRAKEMMISKKVFVAFQPDVRAELKITDAQFEKMKNAFGDSLQIDGERLMITMTGDTDLDQMAKDAMKVLSEEQSKRLKEVWVQSCKGMAIADDDVAKELKITEDQRKSIDKIVDEAANQTMELFGGGNHDDETIKKSQKLREDAGKKLEALLTEDQKKSYEAMKGKEFKFKKSGG